MKATIRDAATIAALPPLEIAQYLRATGWQQVDLQDGRCSVWSLNGQFEVLLPLNIAFKDFPLRIAEVLAVLAQAEHRSELELLADLSVSSADVVRVRIADGELADGSMPIEDYARVAQKTRDLILAAACSALDNRPVWHTRKPDQAVNYLRGVRIGQSERGSYVLTVISRVAPRLQPGQGELFDSEPYPRQVTLKLASALAAVEHAAERAAISGSFEEFAGAVTRGCSVNLCESIVGLAADDRYQRSLEFSFSWSRNRPVGTEQISRIVFAHDRVPLIREAARNLRDNAPIDGCELNGPVIKLERVGNAGPGKITVYALVEDETRHVVIHLPDEEYRQAIAAHENGNTIRASGRLVRAGRGYELLHPSAFTVLMEG